MAHSATSLSGTGRAWGHRQVGGLPGPLTVWGTRHPPVEAELGATQDPGYHGSMQPPASTPAAAYSTLIPSSNSEHPEGRKWLCFRVLLAASDEPGPKGRLRELSGGE